MKALTPVIKQELEDIIEGLSSMSPLAKQALLATCNRADRSSKPQQLARDCKEVTRGYLDEGILREGVKALEHILCRKIEITATYLIVHSDPNRVETLKEQAA